MSDSTLLLIVGIAASIVIAVLIGMLLSEREKRGQLTQHIRTAIQRNNHADLAKIANGTAHPLTAWRIGAGVSAAQMADCIGVTPEDLEAFEEQKSAALDTVPIISVLAAHELLRASMGGDTTSNNATATVMSDGFQGSSTSDSGASVSSSDGGGGGAM